MNKTEKFTSLKKRMCVKVIYNFVNLERKSWQQCRRRKINSQWLELRSEKHLNTSEGCEDLWENCKIFGKRVKRGNLLVKAEKYWKECFGSEWVTLADGVKSSEALKASRRCAKGKGQALNFCYCELLQSMVRCWLMQPASPPSIQSTRSNRRLKLFLELNFS